MSDECCGRSGPLTNSLITKWSIDDVSPNGFCLKMASGQKVSASDVFFRCNACCSLFALQWLLQCMAVGAYFVFPEIFFLCSSPHLRLKNRSCDAQYGLPPGGRWSGRVRKHSRRLWHIIAGHCNVLQRTATCCNALQRTATHCNAMQRTATHCNALQHTAKHCNTLLRPATLQHWVLARASNDTTRGIHRET